MTPHLLPWRRGHESALILVSNFFLAIFLPPLQEREREEEGDYLRRWPLSGFLVKKWRHRRLNRTCNGKGGGGGGGGDALLDVQGWRW